MKISFTCGMMPFYNTSLECKTLEGWGFSLLIDSTKLEVGVPLITPCVIVGDLCFRINYGNCGQL